MFLCIIYIYICISLYVNVCKNINPIHIYMGLYIYIYINVNPKSVMQGCKSGG